MWDALKRLPKLFTPSEDDKKKKLIAEFMTGQSQAEPNMDANPAAVQTLGDRAPVGLAKLLGGTQAPAQGEPIAPTAAPLDENKPALEPPLQGSRKTHAEATAFDEAPAERTKGFWRRLGSGALKGARAWAESGGESGVGGLIGAVASGGITSGISEKTHAEWGKERKSKQLWGKHGDALKKEEMEMANMQEIAKTQKAGLEAQQKAAEPYMKTALEKGYLEPGEVEHIKTKYGVDVTDPNNGRFVTEVRNGKTYIRRVNQPNSVADPTLPVEMTERPYMTTVPGTDKQVPAKPAQVLSTGVSMAQQNAGRIERADVREDKAAETGVKVNADAASAQARLAQSEADLKKAIAAGEPTAGISARIAAAKGDLAKASAMKAGTATKKAASTVTEADVRARYAGKKTPAEIAELIQKARAQGVIR